MAERTNAPVSKTGMGATPSWVRIPLSPPLVQDTATNGLQDIILPSGSPRRVARVDEWARLEIVCARKGTVGSNPTLSATCSIPVPSKSV